MELINSSTFADFVEWYLGREYKKNKRPDDDPNKYGSNIERLEYMRLKHGGKLRDWFETGKWSIQRLDVHNDLDKLVCLESPWTLEYLIPEESRKSYDYRLLKQMVINAKSLDYFEPEPEAGAFEPEELIKRNKYFGKYKEDTNKLLPTLTSMNRIVLCSLGNSEKKHNPSGSYYLHDGFGRLLAYKYLMSYKGFSIDGEIEAFVVEEG